jgi:alpha-galactosidase/6-phospho-beta-glucosidase family protein
VIWREKRALLIVLAVLLAVNVAFFVTYRVRYQQRIADLDQKLADRQNALARMRTDHATAVKTFEDYRRMVQDIQTVYNDYWSTPDQRLTALIVEIKRLATQSRLIPQSTAYNSQSKKKEEFGTTSLQIIFSVQGPYQNVRQLINLLELSKQFVTIDSISINSSASDKLILNLQLRTLFHDTTDEVSRNVT